MTPIILSLNSTRARKLQVVNVLNVAVSVTFKVNAPMLNENKRGDIRSYGMIRSMTQTLNLIRARKLLVVNALNVAGSVTFKVNVPMLNKKKIRDIRLYGMIRAMTQILNLNLNTIQPWLLKLTFLQNHLLVL